MQPKLLFAATESMQNIQVVRNTNGVARYVVKYVVKKDKGNRITLGADFHLGARMNADKNFFIIQRLPALKLMRKRHWRSQKIGSVHLEGALPIPTCRDKF
jgi:hypothetical protein